MRAHWLLMLAASVDVVIPPLPPTHRPRPDHAPAAARLERDGGVSDRFASAGQRAVFPFVSGAGELSVFALESFGYSRGWRSGARIRVLDEQQNVLVEETRDGPSVWHQLLPFVAPAEGAYTYELTSVDQPFRFRLVRRSGLAPRDDAARAIGATELVRSYLRDARDVAAFEIELAAGEEVFLKVANTEEAGRNERRSVNPPRLGPGSIGGYVYATFELAVSIDGHVLLDHQRSTFLRAPRDGTYVVSVFAHAPGAAGLFDLHARRRIQKVHLYGSVRDREDLPLGGAKLTFLHGIDHDVAGCVRSGEDGSYAIDVPPGRLRIRIEDVPHPAEIDAVVEAPRELVLVP